MTTRSVTYEFRGKVDGLQASLATAGKSVGDFGAKLTALDRQGAQMRASLTTIGAAAGKLGLVAAGGFGAAVLASANFEQAMANVRASTGVTQVEFDKLSKAAVDAGARTTFSATEAAGAIENLAKAGVSTTDILGGGLDAALDLAAAGNLEVAQAAELAATTLVQFGLSGTQASRVADTLTAASGKAMGEVQDFGNALRYVGPVAAQMGLSLEETNGALATLAEQGILGEQAGVALRGMLTALTSPSKVAAEAMSDLGMRMYDASGEFIGLDGLAGQLQASMSGLTAAERDQALGRIFGNEQITAARILYAGGAKAVQDWTAAVTDQGYASEVAAARLDTLKGDFEGLMGALETAAIGTGSGQLGILRSLTQDATGLVNAYNGLPPALQETTSEFLALAAIGGGGIWAGSKAINGVASMREALDGLSISGINARKALLAVARGGSVLAGLALANSDVADSTGLANTASMALMGTIAGPWGAAIGGGIGLARDLAAANDTLEKSFKAVSQALDVGAFSSAGDMFSELSGQVADFQDRVSLSTNPFSSDFWQFKSPGDSIASWKNAIEGVFGQSDAEEAAAGLQQVQTQLRLAQDAAVQLAAAMNLTIGPVDGSARSMNELSAVVSTASPAMEELGISFGALQGALLTEQLFGWSNTFSDMLDQIAAQTTYMDSAAGVAGNLGTALVGLDNEFVSTAESAKDFATALETALNPGMNLSEATDAWVTALRTLSEELDENNKTLRGNSEEAITNRAAIRDRVSALQQLLVREAEAGATSQELAVKLRRQKEALIDAGTAAGISERDMRSYLRQLGLTPEIVKTIIEVQTDKATREVKNLRELLSQIHDKDVAINITRNVRNLQSMVPSGIPGLPPVNLIPTKKATGGLVVGPGGPTDDVIPALLSNREFVMSAAAVEHYGVDLFRSLNARKLAAGGQPLTLAAGGPAGGLQPIGMAPTLEEVR